MSYGYDGCGEAVRKYEMNRTMRDVHPENVGVQCVEPAEIFRQPVIITYCVPDYYGVRHVQALSKVGWTACQA